MPRRKQNAIIVAPKTLNDESKEIVQELIPEKDPEKIRDLMDLFNLNQSKKNLARADKYNQLLDNIVDELSYRLQNGSMSSMMDAELLEYIGAINSAMTKVSVDADTIKMPAIQNNTQVNINMVELSRDSREKVADAVKAILAKASGNIIDINSEDNNDR